MYEIERRTGRSVRPVGEPLIDSGAEEPALASAPTGTLVPRRHSAYDESADDQVA